MLKLCLVINKGGYGLRGDTEASDGWGFRGMHSTGGVRTNFTSTSVKATPQHPAYDHPSSPLTQLLEYVANPASQDTWCDPDICARLLVNNMVGQQERRLSVCLLMGAETIILRCGDIKWTLKEMDD
ncbi:hypothetical protein IFM46972_10529 [Aspergillus udagawae]|uniref:Uncharacterized protein n=1 Tax=Aspergillus udagawae TaxID=91492 RepID=A0A8H3XPJ0_9EURO|nr:hypothetical protein IFM46972_10529 [Aspergillus udagawae]